MRGFLLAGLFVLACASEASACFSGARLLDNQTTDATMNLRSGRTCTVVFGRSGVAAMAGVRIDQRPTNGAIEMGSLGKLRYRPKAGYAGSDVFVYTRYGVDGLNKPVTRSVRVAVTVTR